ncbi:MAG: RluA family pseudouridine synthase [Rickettsiales bacterium]|jgi:23S rRNA pseudouridine1911/1915/1917 synthase|nr:RluA family pseudouridine synthase [Rickettsiales bacterium]
MDDVEKPGKANVRVDKFLAEKMPDFSRARIQRMEKNFDNAHRLRDGDVVEVMIPEQESPVATVVRKKRKINIPIIYEDDDIIVVNKPRGMVMYPAAGNASGTLVQELSQWCNLSPLGGSVRPGVVHRIDKDTSGVVILAKTDKAFAQLVKVFSAHKLIRKYIAFVHGVPTWTSADIEGNISRNTRNRQKMSMVKVGGRAAKTSADVINAWTRANVSELRCTLWTGRTHQIRVHLSAHGFGVLTDPLYGKGKEGKIKPGPLLDFLRSHVGQCLHAESLELDHPVTGVPMKFRAPLPDDLCELVEILNSY